MDDTRNIIDYYKHWETEAIKADLREKSHNFSALITNNFNDFNIGTVIRNANAFCAREVIIYGRKQYDRRGTVGTHLYATLRHVKFTEELNLNGAVLVGVDNVENSVAIEDFVWPQRHVIMAFGQEQTGLAKEIADLCSHMVYIKQYGSVRSLNVGCASAIAMYDYCRKMVDNPT